MLIKEPANLTTLHFIKITSGISFLGINSCYTSLHISFSMLTSNQIPTMQYECRKTNQSHPKILVYMYSLPSVMSNTGFLLETSQISSHMYTAAHIVLTLVTFIISCIQGFIPKNSDL